MPRPESLRYAKVLGFALVLLASAALREGSSIVVNQAIVWLPTGVALAGLWWLGLSYWWVVALTTFAQRLLLGYSPHMAVPAAVGSTLEALLGVLVLRRLAFRASLARLRDVMALCAAAAVAPVGSILCSWITRGIVWPSDLPFYSGWAGWWRMNALGALTVAPLALSWVEAPRPSMRGRATVHAILVVLGPVALLLLLMRLATPGTTGVLLLYLALPGTHYAGVRFGPRGAVTSGALSALVVALAATHGLGPFSAVPRVERHVALQLFELSFAVFPILIGALSAERQAALASGLLSEERRRSIQRALPDIAYRVHADGHCVDLYVPDGVTPPYPREAIVGRHLRDFLPTYLAERALETTRRVLSERSTVTLEYELSVQGRRHTREARCVAHGPDEMLAVVRDITHRKQAEATIAFEAQVLELVATGRATSEVFAAIVEGMERLTREALCTIILLEDDRMRVVTAPSLPDAYNAAVDGLVIGPGVGSCGAAAYLGQSVVVEDIATHPLWKNYRELAQRHGLRACWSVPIRDSAGQVLGTFALYYRVPRAPDPDELALAERAGALAGIALERERRSEALRRSEDLLASIHRNVQEGLFRATNQLQLVYANRAFLRMFRGVDTGAGAAADSAADPVAAGAAARDSAASDAPVDRDQLRHLLTSAGNPSGEEVLLRRWDGTTFWGLVSSTEVRGPDGRVLYHDGTVTDITARKELEDRLRQSQRLEAVGRLAGGIAHDFNNLLTAMFGYAESIQRSVTPASALFADAEGVRHAAERAASLTRQLLAYSRRQVLSPRVLELATVVDQLASMLRRIIGENIRLILLHDEPHGRARVDRGQLEQVLLNLVLNARDAMASGGQITVRTSTAQVDAALARMRPDLSPGPYAILSVGDTGEGMTREVQARAFDPFFTTKEQGKGTGLGLSTVYGIVKQSGGAVWLDSRVGVGTVAWIYLPRVEAELEQQTSAALGPPAMLEATVLVVEDEPLVRGLIRETLSQAGMIVLEAADGVEALAESRRQSRAIDLVVTDVVMPRMGGRELALALRAERPGIKVLFMSGYPNDALDLRDLAKPESDFIAKPFAPHEVVERIQRLLRQGAVRG